MRQRGTRTPAGSIACLRLAADCRALGRVSRPRASLPPPLPRALFALTRPTRAFHNLDPARPGLIRVDAASMYEALRVSERGEVRGHRGERLLLRKARRTCVEPARPSGFGKHVHVRQIDRPTALPSADWTRLSVPRRRRLAAVGLGRPWVEARTAMRRRRRRPRSGARASLAAARWALLDLASAALVLAAAPACEPRRLGLGWWRAAAWAEPQSPIGPGLGRGAAQGSYRAYRGRGASSGLRRKGSRNAGSDGPLWWPDLRKETGGRRAFGASQGFRTRAVRTWRIASA
jgi:hypothetical protein